MNAHLLSFTVTAPNTEFSLMVKLDQTTVYQDTVSGSADINCEISQNLATHELNITMSGKTSDHTQIDSNNTIVADETMQFTNFKMAGVDINQIVYENAVYQHQYNSNGPTIQDKFYGIMGCNGTVTLTFSTPLYEWIVDRL
jgi:hypothetical protein